MPKLLNPILYEDVLDDLNTIRPLELADEVKNVIDIAVLNVNPITENKPAIGKLLRCDNNGASLYKNHNGFESYQLKYIISDERDNPELVTFSRRVYGVFAYITNAEDYQGFWVTDSTDTFHGQDIPEFGTTWIKFVGMKLYLHYDALYDDSDVRCTLYGVY